MSEGKKYDTGKAELWLVPRVAIRGLSIGDGEVLRVLAYERRTVDDAVDDIRLAAGLIKAEIGEKWPEALAAVLAHGAEKYGPCNWAKGLRFTRLVSAAMRHVLDHDRGAKKDKDSGLPPLHHALCSLAFLAHYFEHYSEYIAFDDWTARKEDNS